MFATITKLPRFAATCAAALALSAACIGAAVSPAQAERAPAAAAPATLEDWQASLGEQITAGGEQFAFTHDTGVSRKAVVWVKLDAQGQFAGASLKQPSGYWTFDRHALRTAAHLAYPPLPAAYRGRPQTVQVNMLLASRADMPRYEEMAADSRQEELAAIRRASPNQLAAK